LRVQHREDGFGAQFVLALFGNQGLLRQIERRLARRQRSSASANASSWSQFNQPSFLPLKLASSWS
jgi:hypothetical protein